MKGKNAKLLLRISEMPEIKDTLIGINAYDMTLQDLEKFWNKAQQELLKEMDCYRCINCNEIQHLDYFQESKHKGYGTIPTRKEEDDYLW